MPTARGTPAKAAASSSASSRPGSNGTNSVLKKKASTITTEARPSHLNCWRSSPRARRPRTRTEMALSRMASRMRKVAVLVRVSAQPLSVAAPWNGLGTETRTADGDSHISDARTRKAKTTTTASHRQRRDGSRPAGKSRKSSGTAASHREKPKAAK